MKKINTAFSLFSIKMSLFSNFYFFMTFAVALFVEKRCRTKHLLP